jgi:hypothetical protein
VVVVMVVMVVMVVIARSIMPRPHRLPSTTDCDGRECHLSPSLSSDSLSSDWATFGAVAVEHSSQRRPL